MSSLPTHVLELGAGAARVAPAVLDEAVRLALAGGPDHEVPGWQDDALCRQQIPVDAFYPATGAGMAELQAACGRCHVQSACLGYAIWAGERDGVWGGTSQNGRRKLRKVLREAGVLGVTGEDAYLAWLGDGADREPAARPDRAPAAIRPRPHQDEAVASVCAEIRDGGACQIAMATASGKTHVGLWVAEQLDVDQVLVLVPNLALVSQTAKLWADAQTVDFAQLAVCSDTGELDLEATTDPARVREFLTEPGPRVVFATYQSSTVLVDAGVTFDLAVADEAHHLAGDTEKHFAAIVRGEIPTARTLYMTATPRRFRRAKGDVDLIDMDAPAFGPRVYELLLGDAIDRGIVADYRVIVAAVDRATFDRVSRHPGLRDVDPHLLAGAIAVVKTMGAHDLGSCISFHTRIERARSFSSLVGVVAEALPTETPAAPGWSGFLHGGASVRIRGRLLDRLVDDHTWGVVANAKTLGEGVDVPTLDAIAIVDPKTAETDIMQAVGRALRRPGAGVAVGTVVLPVLLAADVDPADPLAGCDPKSINVVAGVLRVLRAHDTDLGSRLDNARRAIGKRTSAAGDVDDVFLARRAMQRTAARGLLRSRVEVHVPGGATSDLAGAIALQVIRESTSSWDEAYGRLLAWVDEHGATPGQTAKVPDVTGTFSLGAWCGSQRTDRKRGLLDPDRVARLEQIPAWSWEPREEGWWAKLDMLREYVELRGWPPAKAGEGMWRGASMANFIRGCRAGYDPDGKEGGWLRKFPDRVAALEAIPGWVWNARDAEWEAHFDQLARYVRLTGHANPGAGETVDGFDIGKWVQKQRSRMRGGVYYDSRRSVMREESLSPERTERLRALPGWVDHTRDAGWDVAYDRLVDYVQREGQLPPQGHVADDGFTLGGWVATQRDRRRNNKLSDDRRRRLERIPCWVWEPLAESWEYAYGILRRFAEQSTAPILRIPIERVDGYDLNSFCGRQRAEHRAGTLAADRAAALEQIPGWVWDVADAKFTAGLDAARAYIEREGHCEPPSSHREGHVQLRPWITQRRAEHAAGRLAPDRVARLEQIPGWTWAPPMTAAEQHERQWLANYEAFRRYVADTGDATPRLDLTVGGRRLGAWAAKQRAHHRNDRLSSDRAARLEQIPGWSWDLRDRDLEAAS